LWIAQELWVAVGNELQLGLNFNTLALILTTKHITYMLRRILKGIIKGRNVQLETEEEMKEMERQTRMQLNLHFHKTQ
jgi:hypothetical protein